MKHFLLFLLFFFYSFAGFGTPYPVDEISGKIQGIKTESKKEEYAPIKIDKNSYQEQIRLAAQTEKGFLTGEKGLGLFQKTGFGKFRLISCYGSVSNKNQVFLMLEGVLDKGWQLQKPTIPYEKNPLILEEKILYPINSFKEKQTLFYENEVLIPLIYKVDENLGVFEIKKEISLTACKEQNCLTETVFLSLNLAKENQELQTDLCPKMMHALQKVPVPPTKGEIKNAFFNVKDGQNAQFVVDFNDEISFLNIQMQIEEPWTIMHKEVDGKRALILIKTNDTQKLDNAEVNLSSSLGMFKVFPPLKMQPYILPNKEISYLNVFFSGVWLFCLSPLFLLFWQLPGDKEKLLKRVKNIRLSVFALAFMLALLCLFNVDIVRLFEVRSIEAIFIFLCLMFLLIKPQISPLMAIPLFFIFPKPYLVETLYAVDVKSWQPFIVFFVWALVALLPFSYLKDVPAFFKQVKKVKQYPYLIRLPQILLLGWLIMGGLSSIMFKENKINDFKIANETNKTIFVSVENGCSLTGFLNKLTLSYLKNNTSVLNNNELNILTFKTYSDEGKTFVAQNNLLPISQNLLYGEKQSYPLIINEYVSFEKWSNILKNVTKVGKFSDYLKQK